jgi:hypothetical protein
MKNKNYHKTPSIEKVLRCLNKLNNYAKLPVDHRWVSIVRHYIKESPSHIKEPPAIPQSQDEICSNSICDYCENKDCGGCNNSDNLFVGRRLSPVVERVTSTNSAM